MRSQAKAWLIRGESKRGRKWEETMRDDKMLCAAALAVALFASVALSFAQQTSPSRNPEWHAMGSAPCVWAAPIRGLSNALDLSATIQDLRDNGFDCYVHVIENAPPNTLEDLERLLPAAQAAGISVWPVLIPPSEGGNSLPYKTDYLQWIKALAQLSLKYSALRGVNIDDSLIGISSKTFTQPYLCRLYQTRQRINPKFLLISTIYDLDRGVADRLAGCVDGVWLWWVNLEMTNGMRSLLEDSQFVVGGRFPVYAGVYAHQTSWHQEGDPAPKILQRALEIACCYSDGAVIWNLPLAPKSSMNPLLTVARSFAPGGSATLAGKCGEANASAATLSPHGAKP
jgi:hypothetical protein